MNNVFSTNEFADVFGRIAPALGNLIEDKEVNKNLTLVMQEAQKGDNMLALAAMVKYIAPLICGKHRNDIYYIVAQMTGKTVQQIGEQGLMETVKDVKTVFTGDFVNFIRSVAQSVQEQ